MKKEKQHIEEGSREENFGRGKKVENILEIGIYYYSHSIIFQFFHFSFYGYSGLVRELNTPNHINPYHLMT